tara:strand:- start:406 stop:861 length:456 start_codon:yes stop_codon:yes gene_type:complete
MSIELKIKSKHLGQEARIIRFEERKLLKNLRSNIDWHKANGSNDEYAVWQDKHFNSYSSLHSHRTINVRNENRATFLARAYIEGTPYLEAENNRKPEKEYDFNYVILPRVIAMVLSYGKLAQVDREYCSTKRRQVATKALKDKISTWCDAN